MKKKIMLEMLSTHIDLARTRTALVTYASTCHGVNMGKVEKLPSRGMEYLHSTKNDK